MMKRRSVTFLLLAGLLLLSVGSCTQNRQKEGDRGVALVDENVSFAAGQYSLMLAKLEDSARILNPKSVIDGKMKYIPPQEWTSGFFPGSLWYLYELTGDEKWMMEAVKYTESLDTIQYFTDNHDVGFMIYCSYGNGLRLAGTEAYKGVIVNAAR